MNDVTHGQCESKPTAAFPLRSITVLWLLPNFCYLVTWAHGGESTLDLCYASPEEIPE